MVKTRLAPTGIPGQVWGDFSGKGALPITVYATDSFFSLTGVIHQNNPTGAATLTTVFSTVVTTPIDPASKVPSQDFPIEKLFLLKECFTKYPDFATGDYLVFAGVTYAVRAVWPWAAQGGMDAYVHLILEMQLGS